MSDEVKTEQVPTQVETPTQPQSQPGQGEPDFSWIDNIGVMPEQQPQPSEPPVRVIERQVVMPPQAPPEKPNDIIGFVKDPKRWAAEVVEPLIEQRVSERVAPLREAFEGMLKNAYTEGMNQAVTIARDNLRAFAAQDPSIRDERVSGEINRIYGKWIAEASRGDRAALLALTNPDAPAVLAYKISRKAQAGNRPVRYAGGTQEAGSTVSSGGSQNLTQEEMALASKWGAALGKDLVADWSKNNTLSEAYLRQK